MAHLQQREFCNFVKQKFPDFFKGKLILDVGALDLNGNNKFLFQDCLYIGVDIASGPNVDIVSKGHELGLPDESFETIVSTECFEHDQYYALTIKNIYRMLKPGGLFFFSCATTGRPEHGTRRSAPQDAPLLQNFGDWADYYQNLTESDIREIFDVECLFKEYGFLVNEESHDLYFYGIKKGDLKNRSDYSFLVRDKVVQLFKDTGAGFSEASSDSQSIVSAISGPAGTHEFAFDLSGDQEIRALRLDPLNDSAIIEIEKLVLVTRSGEIDLLPNIQTNATHFDGRRYFFQTADPQIYFDGIGAELLLDAQSLNVRILYVHTGQVACQLAALTETRNELGNSQTALAQAQTELSETRGALESTYATLNQTQSALTESRYELGNSQTVLEQTRIELFETRSKLESAYITMNQTQSALAESGNELESTKTALTQNQAALAESRNELESTQAELDQRRSDLLRVQSALSEQKANLHRMRTSLGWRLTAPLRRLNGFMHTRVLGYSRLAPIPIHHLEALDGKVGHRWHATASDPQFLLRPLNPAVLRRGQWFLIKFEWQCQIPVVQQLFIDCGQGYQDHASLTFRVEKSGEVSIPLCLPQSFKGLRLDPMTAPGEFEIRDIKICQARRRPAVPTEHEGVVSYLQALDGCGFQLYPLSDLQFDASQTRHWQSLGSDPHFLLKPHDGNNPSEGWHRAELRIHSEKERGVGRFYFDTGSGFNETEALSLAYDSDDLAERIVFIDKPIHSIRFDPKEEPAGFRIDVLRLTPLSEKDAVLEMARRLIARHADFVEIGLSQVINVVNQGGNTGDETPAQSLIKTYNTTFPALQAPKKKTDYNEWIDQVERPALPTQEAVALGLARLAYRPLISIVMPVYNTPEAYLRECIESVLAQSYPHWELCIADDASPRVHVGRILQEYQGRDARIRIDHRTENGHISRASNSAIELARGDYLALLDHDDTLSEHALYFMACVINEQPDVQILYSDEDKIDTKGQRFDPHFKSDWNPDLFFSQNYVSHLGVYRRDLIDRIGGFRTGVEGSQDQDLLLRCLPHVRHAQIAHVPRVLYHWRMAEGSTALASGEKSYTTDAGVKALRDYFATAHPAAAVEAAQLPNTYRVRWPLPEPAPLVSLLIPTRDRRALTETCIRSILDKSTYTHYEILILDNGSVEAETLEFFEQIQQEDGRVRVLRYDHPFNYSAINNFGVAHAKGEMIGLVNNDIEVISPEWLTEMVSHALRPEIGCVGAKLCYDDETIQHAGVIVGLGGTAGHSHKYFARDAPGYFNRLKLIQNLSAVTAACLVVRKSTYEQVGGLEEEGLRVAFNDVDFCLKVREAGYRNLWTPYAELYHHESISRGHEDTPEKLGRFHKEIQFLHDKWGAALAQDPYYNPNLTKQREDWSLK